MEIIKDSVSIIWLETHYKMSHSGSLIILPFLLPRCSRRRADICLPSPSPSTCSRRLEGTDSVTSALSVLWHFLVVCWAEEINMTLIKPQMLISSNCWTPLALMYHRDSDKMSCGNLENVTALVFVLTCLCAVKTVWVRLRREQQGRKHYNLT